MSSRTKMIAAIVALAVLFAWTWPSRDEPAMPASPTKSHSVAEAERPLELEEPSEALHPTSVREPQERSATTDAAQPEPEAGEVPFLGAPLSSEEIKDLRDSFAALHANRSREELKKDLDFLIETIPVALVIEAHAAKLESGEYETLDVIREDEDGKVHASFSSEFLAQSVPIIDRWHIPLEGPAVQTHILPADIPAYEQDIHQIVWLMEQVRERKP